MSSIAERLRRKPEQYAGASPKAIAAGSTAQMMYFVEDAQADIATLLGEIDRLTRERDEADRAAGAAARRIADLEDTAIKRSNWLREAKAAAGYTDNTSFDDVWAEALAALLEKRAALNAAAQAQGD